MFSSISPSLSLEQRFWPGPLPSGLNRPASGAAIGDPSCGGGAFCGAVVLSGLVHNEWYRVIPHTLRTAGVVLACFLAVNAFRSRPVHTLAGWLLALATLFYCSFGLAQFPTVYAGRVASLFTNPNQFAGYLNLLFPFVLLMFFSSGGRRVRFLWAFLTLALLVMLVTTQSRSGLGAALITAGFLWWLYYREKLADFWRAPGLSARSFLRRSALSLAGGLLALCVVSLFVASIPEFRGKLSEAGEALQRRSWRGVWGSIENARLLFAGSAWRCGRTTGYWVSAPAIMGGWSGENTGL